MILKKITKIIIILLFPVLCFAADTIPNFEEESLPILNEELRKLTVSTAKVTLPPGAVFFMVTGSCPDKTTDVSATYSNKFARINATAGSTGGADTDSITLGTTNVPSHTHTLNLYDTSGSDTPVAAKAVNITGGAIPQTTSTGSGSGTAFSVDTVPAFVTFILCLVDG